MCLKYNTLTIINPIKQNASTPKNIANLFIDGNVGLDETIRDINLTCKFKLQVYYIGLIMISQADVEALTEKDYDYLLINYFKKWIKKKNQT